MSSRPSIPKETYCTLFEYCISVSCSLRNEFATLRICEGELWRGRNVGDVAFVASMGGAEVNDGR